MKLKVWLGFAKFLVICVSFIFGLDSDLIFADNQQSNVYELGEIVVTSPYSVENQSRLTGVSVFTENDFKNINAQTVGDVIEYIAGSDVKNISKGETRLKIRGFAQEDLQVLIDGVPAKECYFGTLDISAIPIKGIAKIVISKGASSVLYGANTMGGVVNIITKKSVGDNKNFSADFSAGNNCSRNFTGEYSNSIGKFDYYILYNYNTTDGFDLSSDFNAADPNIGSNSSYREDGGLRNNSWYVRRTINSKICYKPDNSSEYYFTFDYHNNNRGLPIQNNRFWTFPVWRQWNISLASKNIINNNLALKTRIYYVKHRDELADDTNLTITAYHGRSFSDYSIYDDYTAGGDIQAEMNFDKYGILTGSFNYIKDQNKHCDYNTRDKNSKIIPPGGWTPEEINEAATYNFAVEHKINFLNSLNLISGASFDFYKPENSTELATDTAPLPDNMNSINPQIGMRYYFSNNMNIFCSISKKTRFPHLKELFSQHAGGDPELKPQKNIISEFGIEWTPKSGIYSSISFFHNKVDDLISTVKTGSITKYININKSKIKGLEAELRYDFNSKINSYLAYTYLDAENEITGQTLSEIPEQKLSFISNINLPYNFSTNIQAIYTGSQYSNDALPREIAGYTVINFRIQKNLMIAKKYENELYFEVNNISDKLYEESSGPTPGRNYVAGCKIEF